MNFPPQCSINEHCTKNNLKDCSFVYASCQPLVNPLCSLLRPARHLARSGSLSGVASRHTIRIPPGVVPSIIRDCHLTATGLWTRFGMTVSTPAYTGGKAMSLETRNRTNNEHGRAYTLILTSLSCRPMIPPLDALPMRGRDGQRHLVRLQCDDDAHPAPDLSVIELRPILDLRERI